MYVYDYPKILSAFASKCVAPKSITELQTIVTNNFNLSNPLPISIAGGKFSHGGHTFTENCLYIDMKYMNSMYLVDSVIKVQAGATWIHVQDFLDKYNLSVAEMQSYANFSVGGSISVNCHGRGLKYGTIADTIKSMDIMMSSGNILTVYPRDTLFKAVVGGYGAVAIIISATLIVEPNVRIKRKIIKTSYTDLPNILPTILNDPKIQFYNTNIYPGHQENIYTTIWYKTKQPLTIKDRLQKHTGSWLWNVIQEQLVRRFGFFQDMRYKIETNDTEPIVCYRNYEMGYDTNMHEPYMHYPTTTILQEYFVPIDGMMKFYTYFWNIHHKYAFNLLNLSIRYVRATDIPILNYAPEDRVSFVLYLNVGNNNWCLNYAQQWTQILITAAIKLGGAYYLPYLPFATCEQFEAAYPNHEKLFKIKRKYDPKNILQNMFLNKYIL